MRAPVFAAMASALAQAVLSAEYFEQTESVRLARVQVPDPVIRSLFDYGMYRFGTMEVRG